MEVVKYTTSEELQQWIDQLPIGERLLVSDVPNDVYHKSVGYGSTTAREATISEQRFYISVTEESEETDALNFGSLGHDWIAYGEEYCKQHYVPFKFAHGGSIIGKLQKGLIKHKKQIRDLCLVVDDSEKQSDKAKQARAAGKIVCSANDLKTARAAQKEVADRVIIHPDDWDKAADMAAMVYKNDWIRAQLEKSRDALQVETSVWLRVSETLVLKCRPDLWSIAGKAAFDWKSIANIIKKYNIYDITGYLKNQFLHTSQNRGYIFSARYYSDVAGLNAFCLVFMDKKTREIFPCLVPRHVLDEESDRIDAAISTMESVIAKTANFSKAPEIPLDSLSSDLLVLGE